MTTEERIIEAIKRGFTYDPITGNIYNHKGKLVIRKNSKGYIYPSIQVNGERYSFKGHQFAWYYIYGKMPDYELDHINNIRSDNRIENLRDVKHLKNMWNTSRFNITLRKSGKYQARIQVNGDRKYLGLFLTYDEAKNAILEAKKVYHII